jgi:hypothetical protein
MYAPWWPGQCIDCNMVNGEADPTGTFCGKCGGLTLMGIESQFRLPFRVRHALSADSC